MARIRTIKPEFPQSETMGRVSRDARLLFIQLWTVADDSGRTRGNSRVLASLLYPYDDDARSLIDGWLAELEGVGAVRRYVVEGETFLDIPNWLKHQKIDRPSASKFPAFGESSRVLASPRELSPPDLDREGIKEGKGRERNAREEPPHVPRGTSDAESAEGIATLKGKYPPNAARENWIAAEKAARRLVEAGDATWESLAESVDRYARLCRATNRVVMNPANFFTAEDRPWSQRWPMPTTKAQAAQDANVEASLAWLREQEARDAAG